MHILLKFYFWTRIEVENGLFWYKIKSSRCSYKSSTSSHYRVNCGPICRHKWLPGRLVINTEADSNDISKLIFRVDVRNCWKQIVICECYIDRIWEVMFQDVNWNCMLHIQIIEILLWLKYLLWCRYAGSLFEVKIETDSNDAVEIKTEADSNERLTNEYLHNDEPCTGMFVSSWWCIQTL